MGWPSGGWGLIWQLPEAASIDQAATPWLRRRHTDAVRESNVPVERTKKWSKFFLSLSLCHCQMMPHDLLSGKNSLNNLLAATVNVFFFPLVNYLFGSFTGRLFQNWQLDQLWISAKWGPVIGLREFEFFFFKKKMKMSEFFLQQVRSRADQLIGYLCGVNIYMAVGAWVRASGMILRWLIAFWPSGPFWLSLLFRINSSDYLSPRENSRLKSLRQDVCHWNPFLLKSKRIFWGIEIPAYLIGPLQSISLSTALQVETFRIPSAGSGTLKWSN